MPPTTVTASVRMAKQCCAILPIVSSTNSRCLTRVESMGRLSLDLAGSRPAHGQGEQDGPGKVKIARAAGNFPIQVLFILALYDEGPRPVPGRQGVAICVWSCAMIQAGIFQAGWRRSAMAARGVEAPRAPGTDRERAFAAPDEVR